MKKIICIACMSVISVFGYVSSYDFYDRSQSPDSPYAAQILEQSYGNQSITSKKRNTFHKSKPSKKIKQTEQDFKDLDLYDKYCDNPDLFLTDLKKEGTNPSYINSMIYTLKKYNFFYESWKTPQRKKVYNYILSQKKMYPNVTFDECPYEKYSNILSNLQDIG